MGNSPVSALRAATLAAQMQAAKLSPETLPGQTTMTEVAPKLIRERSVKTCRFLPGGDAMTESVKEITEQLREWGFE
jgi:hypothetical protein